MNQTNMNQYSGTSNNQNFQEALDNAILEAKEDNPSNFGSWRLIEIAGTYGGVTGISAVTVTISLEVS